MRLSNNAIALLAVTVATESIPRAARPPTVDLGYAVYEGVFDGKNSINAFKGIRYAAPPLGRLRFAAPQPPSVNTTSVISATKYPPICPQTGSSSEVPPVYGFISGPGDEDCLFLNVFAPNNAKDLPIFFWIHGGGYGLFSSTGLDPTEFMATNNNSFISVIIQYRLGAFGFLSSEDVKQEGALNAGLLDMNFALQWVQKYANKFGGDPSRVTVAGESAGGGAVLYQSMAYGGKQNASLFQNVIAASPWIPYQYSYDDETPTASYNDFVSASGCANATSKLECLRQANTQVLQNASAEVSEAGPFGTFAFLPVTDGVFVQQLPTQQLASKALQGKRILSSNMASEGVPLSPPTTRTLQDFRDYINTTFPHFTAAQKAAIESQYLYEGDMQPVDHNAPLFATSGTHLPSSVNQSTFGTGQQQRVFAVFGEYAFICPSYWAASAFPTAWKYQFSALPSYHGYDLQALWSGTPSPGASFKHAFRRIWGNFIVHNTPVISVADAKGGTANSTVPIASDSSEDVAWPQWNNEMSMLLNLNATGGAAKLLKPTDDLFYNVYTDPGVVNQISLAGAKDWDGGRGKRCEFWKSVAADVPY